MIHPNRIFRFIQNVKSSLLNARFECPRVTTIMEKEISSIFFAPGSRVDNFSMGLFWFLQKDSGNPKMASVLKVSFTKRPSLCETTGCSA